MKAVVLHEYGGPEKLKLEDRVANPQVAGDTVLIATAAASVEVTKQPFVKGNEFQPAGIPADEMRVVGLWCFARHGAVLFGTQLFNLLMPKTIHGVVVDHSGGLHHRVTNRRTDELEAAPQQIPAHRVARLLSHEYFASDYSFAEGTSHQTNGHHR